MKRIHGIHSFESKFVADKQEGWVGFDLFCSGSDKSRCVARLIYWEANGEFLLETFDTDVPLVVIEELIAEAKSEIKLK